MENFLWVIPAAPLAAFIITILFGRGVLKSQAHWPAIIGVGIAVNRRVADLFSGARS